MGNKQNTNKNQQLKDNNLNNKNIEDSEFHYMKYCIKYWGLGIEDWGLGPIPNPQSPIPNNIFYNILVYTIKN